MYILCVYIYIYIYIYVYLYLYLNFILFYFCPISITTCALILLCLYPTLLTLLYSTLLYSALLCSTYLSPVVWVCVNLTWWDVTSCQLLLLCTSPKRKANLISANKSPPIGITSRSFCTWRLALLQSF